MAEALLKSVDSGCWLNQRPVGKKRAPRSATAGWWCGGDREQRWTLRNWRRRRLVTYDFISCSLIPTPIPTEQQSCSKGRPRPACKQAADLESHTHLRPFPDNEAVIVELSLSAPLQLPSELSCCTDLIATQAGLSLSAHLTALTSTLI